MVARDSARVRVVLFSGGRGSGALSKQLVQHPHIDLTIAINGYDDGASTGEVRRFLGDALGPSDFRKNASRLAGELHTCPPGFVEMLDARLPEGVSGDQAIDAVRQRAAAFPESARRVEAFVAELARTGRPFNFADCSVGNLVFAGSFLLAGRQFNAAVDDYCAMVGLPAGLVENVTNGEDAHLVAIGEAGAVLGSEEEIVGASGKNRIREIFLIDRALDRAERESLNAQGAAAATQFFAAHRATVTLNPRLANALAEADLIIYAPGTQHSSLFPSYLTPGLGQAVARNLKAIKLLVTNIQTDAEIEGSSAVDIIERALFYMNEKGQRSLPPPCVITHYLVNDPGTKETDAPYVPLGAIESLEDPRLVRIANYEDGVSGRHDAAKILGPFVQSLVERRERQRLAIVIQGTASLNKVTQTLMEMVRGGIADTGVAVTVFYAGQHVDRGFLDSLPFSVVVADTSGVQAALAAGRFDYVMLFESSGMYRGEDAAMLASHLAIGRLDAVWGSRRLSVRDIQESLRFRYQKSPLSGFLSRFGSHLLSLACLVFHGRYISDTLSGLRAVRAEDAMVSGLPLDHPRINQHLLARLLRRQAEILEIPVQFLPISPDLVRRTTMGEGFRALGVIIAGRWNRAHAPQPTPHAAPRIASRPGDSRDTAPASH